MLSLLLAAVTTFSATAPTPASGLFSYSQNYQIDSYRRDEMVDTKTAPGKIRFSELTNDEYTCYNKGASIYLCHKFLSPPEAQPEFISLKLSKIYSGWGLQLQPTQHTPSLDYESPHYVLWKLIQNGSLGTKNYDFVEYSWNDGPYKVILRSNPAKADAEFIYMSPDTLYSQHFFSRQTRMVTENYFVSAILTAK